jgi:hypothetical protein
VIDLENNLKVKLKQYIVHNGTVVRSVKLTDANSELTFTDREFENFDHLIKELPIKECEKKAIDFAQAKGNISAINFNFYILIAFLIFLIGNTIWNSGFHYIVIIFFVTNSILLIATLKRRWRYKRVLAAKA